MAGFGGLAGLPAGLYAAPTALGAGRKAAGASAAEPAAKAAQAMAMYPPQFYMACTAGGVASCGLTHMLVTPLDVVKCNMQTDPGKYRSIFQGFSLTVKEPGLLGYAAQGACKFGLYEFFKKYYSDMAGEENAAKYKTGIFLAGSASAEFFADIALCPFEAVKVKMQTVPGFATSYTAGFTKFVQQEGFGGLYKGLTPLWGRQIPYTMVKFACFENVVQALYKYVVPRPMAECTKPEKLAVSFAAGYIAGV